MGGMTQCPPFKYALISTFKPKKVLMVDFQKKSLDKMKVFVVRDEAPYFSEARGFSLPGLLVNPSLPRIDANKTVQSELRLTNSD